MAALTSCAMIVGDRSARIAVASMPVAFSQDLQWHIVWHHLYKEASLQDIAEALYVSEKDSRAVLVNRGCDKHANCW